MQEAVLAGHEAKLRLKRWFVAGQFQEQCWPDGKKRENHLKSEGQGLGLLATGAAGWSEMSDDELNDACRIVPPAT